MIEFNDRRLVEADPAKGTISHTRARDIASKYGNGVGALGALATTGRVTQDAVDEANKVGEHQPTKYASRDLSRLTRYATKNVGRGPVNGWQDMQ